MEKQKTISIKLETWKRIKEIQNEMEQDGEKISFDKIIFNLLSNERRIKT